MSDKINLTKYAINYLSKFSSSKANLERILKGKIRRSQIEKQEKFILYNSINNIIVKLEENNFINDFDYSSSKIRNFAQQGKSKIFIKSYFINKGVEKEIINKTLDDYELENPSWEMESAKTFIRKKRLIKKIENKQKNLSKMARSGFSYDISIKLLDEV